MRRWKLSVKYTELFLLWSELKPHYIYPGGHGADQTQYVKLIHMPSLLLRVGVV
jgi:hypothetical protein